MDAVARGLGAKALARAPGLSFNNAVAMLGDSLVANGQDSNTYWSSRNWGQWGAGLSGHRFFISNVIGGGGYRSDQVLGILSNILNGASVQSTTTAKPGYCAVLAGTNDLGQSVALSTIIAYLRQIYDGLRNAGIIPIMCTLTPRNDIAADNIMKLNAAIAQMANMYNAPLCDFWSACADPATGQWKSGYNADSIHPNATGAKAMGVVLQAALSFLPATIPTLMYQNNSIMWSNSLFLTDATADGFPDGWAKNASFDANATSALLTTETGITGNAWQITLTTNTAGALFPRSSGVTAAPGDWLAVMFKYNFAPAGTSPSFTVAVRQATPSVGTTFTGMAAGTSVAAVATSGYLDYYQVFRIPTTATTATIMAEIGAQGSGSVLKVAQFGIHNLTAMGLSVQ